MDIHKDVKFHIDGKYGYMTPKTANASSPTGRIKTNVRSEITRITDGRAHIISRQIAVDAA